MATEERDYSHRTAVQKLGVKPDERVEVAGDVGSGPAPRRQGGRRPRPGALRRARRRDRAGGVDGRGRGGARPLPGPPRDTGYLWIITRKRGHERYLNQMTLVPRAKRLGLIDNKTCSIDDERSGIRFVVPRALRKQNAA